jgi:hypothetical protein
MVIAVYISGHGLGHASRTIELIEVLTSRQPDLEVIIRTSAHSWVFDRVRSPTVDVQAFQADTGIAQIDSLRLDEDLTAGQAAAFYADFDRRSEAEAAFLQRAGADVVVGDIPPLAFASAHLARLPSVAVSNFTWDWIYAYYPRFATLAPGVIDTIARAYSVATLGLRLPFHGGFTSLASVTHDVPFIARRSNRDPAETRHLLGLDGKRPFILASFGGYGVALPFEQLAKSDLTVLAPPTYAPAGLRYEDLVAAADVVVSKPGYGIVSECVANETPLLYTSRGNFAEYEVMVAEMPRFLRCRFFEQEDLLSGNWRAAIDGLLAQPPPPERPATNGADTVADWILELVGKP